MTLKALAGRLGVSDAAVSQWEQEQTTPHASTLLGLPGLLGVSAIWLFYGVGLPEPSANATIPFSLREVGEARVPRVSAESATAQLDHAVARSSDFVPAVQAEPAAGDFSITIWDDSNSPKFATGDWVILRGKVEPRLGDYALVAIGPGRDPAFGQLGRGPARAWTLRFENPLWGTLPITDEDEIVAIMLAHVSKLRRD